MKKRLMLVVVGAVAVAVAIGAAYYDEAPQAGIAQTSQSFDTLVFDYNLDGTPDFLFSPQNATAGRQLWQGNADGTFTLVTHLKGSVTTDQHGCTTADFDGNGLPDIACAMGAVHGTRTKSDPLWLQQSGGTFTLDESAGLGSTPIDPLGRGYSAVALDANNDGLPDLFLDNASPRPDGQPTPNRLYLNAGFDPASGAWLGLQNAGPSSGLQQEGQGGRGCDFTTDLNADGNADLIFCGKGHMYVFLGDGFGHFTDTTQAHGLLTFFAADAELVDMNGDGLRDLVYVRANQWGIRLGKPNGVFGAATATHTETAGRMLSVVDANGDGKLDVYVLQGNGAPGCLTCKTNQPDQLWLGDGKLGFAQTDIPEATTGSGDTVNAIGSRFIVGNGANLMTGPLQLIAVSP